MLMAKNGNTITWRVCQLEKEVSDLNDRIERILTNELPHINENIISMKTRVNVLTGVNIGAVILLAVLERLLN